MDTNSTNLRIAMYNLRYDSQSDQITVPVSISAPANPLGQEAFLGPLGEQPWSTRRLRVAEYLLSEDILIAEFQESLVRQANDLAELFGDDWGWVRAIFVAVTLFADVSVDRC